jgi:hypothetical protein
LGLTVSIEIEILNGRFYRDIEEPAFLAGFPSHPRRAAWENAVMGGWLFFCFSSRNSLPGLPGGVRSWPCLLQGGSRCVPALLGLLLLAAAALKAHQLASGPSVDSSWTGSPWLRLGLIELELGLGLCLLCGLYPRQSRLAALISFTAFAAVSFQQALAGKASCSCLGALAVRPWHTFLLDLGAVAALWQWQPDRNGCTVEGGVEASSPGRVRLLLFGLLILPGALLAVRAAGQASAPRLRVVPELLDMGRIPAGGSKEVAFSLTNPGKLAVRVARLDTSCPCLKIELPSERLAPGETVTGKARIDLSAEADFVGDLAIDVQGLNEQEAAVLAFLVQLEVLPR